MPMQSNIGACRMENGKIKGALYVLISAVCFALAGVLIKSIDWNALSISGARSIFAAGVLYAYLRLQGKHLTINKPTIAGAAVNFAMLQTFVAANKLTNAANAIVLQFTMPAWIIFISLVILHEKPRRSAVVACIVIFAGIVCFFFDKLGPTGLVGNIVAVISGIAYAGVFMMKRIPGCNFESAAILSFLGCTACGLPFIVQETDFSFAVIAAIIALGVVQVGCAYIFLSKGLDYVSPLTASLLSTLEPILNPILVAIALGETIGPLSLVGAALVIVASTAYNVHAART